MAPTLAAAADMRHRVDDPPIEQRGQAALELRLEGGLIGSVAVQQARGAAVEGNVIPVGDRHRDRRAVGRRRRETPGPVAARVVPGNLRPLEQLPLARAEVELIPGEWLDQRFLADDHRTAVVLLGVLDPYPPRGHARSDLADVAAGVVGDHEQLLAASTDGQHQVLGENVTSVEPRVVPGGGDGLAVDRLPVIAGRRGQRCPHQCELLSPGIGDHVQIAGRASVVDSVVDAVLPRCDQHRVLEGSVQVDHPDLGRCRCYRSDDRQLSAARALQRQIEALV